MRTLNLFRWRLARLIAPSPIVAAPTGDEKAFIFLRPSATTSAWIAPRSMTINMETPPIPDTTGLATLGPSTVERGTFSGTL